MIPPALRRSAVLSVLAVLLLVGGCARYMDTGKTSLKPKSVGELQAYLLNHKADLDQFRLRGPFDVAAQEDFEIRLSTTELVKTDLYLSGHAEKAPLVIFLHGYDASKGNHAFQAMHVASWGMHALALQLPNKGPWIANGKTLAKIVRFIQRWPEIVDGRIDVNKIILVGHSFGGAAVAVALAEGAPAAGGILLDPAAVSRDLPAYLRKINTPVAMIAADEHVVVARNREYFFRSVRAGIFEVSIKDAAHEDAQYPADTGAATEELQVTFVSTLTAAAISLAASGNLDYAWNSFGDAIKSGQLIDVRRK